MIKIIKDRYIQMIFVVGLIGLACTGKVFAGIDAEKIEREKQEQRSQREEQQETTPLAETKSETEKPSGFLGSVQEQLKAAKATVQESSAYKGAKNTYGQVKSAVKTTDAYSAYQKIKPILKGDEPVGNIKKIFTLTDAEKEAKLQKKRDETEAKLKSPEEIAKFKALNPYSEGRQSPASEFKENLKDLMLNTKMNYTKAYQKKQDETRSLFTEGELKAMDEVDRAKQNLDTAKMSHDQNLVGAAQDHYDTSLKAQGVVDNIIKRDKLMEPYALIRFKQENFKGYDADHAKLQKDLADLNQKQKQQEEKSAVFSEGEQPEQKPLPVGQKQPEEKILATDKPNGKTEVETTKNAMDEANTIVEALKITKEKALDEMRATSAHWSELSHQINLDNANNVQKSKETRAREQVELAKRSDEANNAFFYAQNTVRNQLIAAQKKADEAKTAYDQAVQKADAAKKQTEQGQASKKGPESQPVFSTSKEEPTTIKQQPSAEELKQQEEQKAGTEQEYAQLKKDDSFFNDASKVFESIPLLGDKKDQMEVYNSAYEHTKLADTLAEKEKIERTAQERFDIEKKKDPKDEYDFEVREEELNKAKADHIKTQNEFNALPEPKIAKQLSKEQDDTLTNELMPILKKRYDNEKTQAAEKAYDLLKEKDQYFVKADELFQKNDQLKGIPNAQRMEIYNWAYLGTKNQDKIKAYEAVLQELEAREKTEPKGSPALLTLETQYTKAMDDFKQVRSEFEASPQAQDFNLNKDQLALLNSNLMPIVREKYAQEKTQADQAVASAKEEEEQLSSGK